MGPEMGIMGTKMTLFPGGQRAETSTRDRSRRRGREPAGLGPTDAANGRPGSYPGTSAFSLPNEPTELYEYFIGCRGTTGTIGASALLTTTHS
jgi:hypothetical protein